MALAVMFLLTLQLGLFPFRVATLAKMESGQTVENAAAGY